MLPFRSRSNRRILPAGAPVLVAATLLLGACTPRTTETGSAAGVPPLPPGLSANAFATEPPNAFCKEYATSAIPWQPWTTATREAARTGGRPILLHIGYSTCPFSRQFRASSLADPEVAAFFRDHFVCVLADADSDPAINHILLETLPKLGGAPAWPILAWLSPEGIPFRAHDFSQANGFSTHKVLASAERAWKEWRGDSDFVRRQSRDVAEILDKSTQVKAPAKREPDPRVVEETFHSLARYYNEGSGTLSPGQNFPRPTTIRLLLAMSTFFPEKGFRSDFCRNAAANCLRKMAAGAIHDPLDGGWHRYSEKPNWNAPHSEKLAQDQALMASTYLDGAECLQDESLRRIAFETLDQMMKSWARPDGLLGHASTAFDTARGPDQQPPFLAPWFTWSAQEIRDALGKEEWQVASVVHGIRERGNMPPSAFSPAFGNRCNVLATFVPPEAAAASLGLDAGLARERLASAHAKLRALRAKRQGFFFDDRATVTANALAVEALAAAARQPGGSRFAAQARQLFDHLVSLFLDAQGKLKGSYAWQGDVVPAPATHLDYALMVQAALAIHDLEPSPASLALAESIQAAADNDFRDSETGAYLAYSAATWTGVGKPWIVIGDAATPADNAVACRNLARLAALSGKTAYATQRESTLALARSNSTQILTAHALILEVARELAARRPPPPTN